MIYGQGDPRYADARLGTASASVMYQGRRYLVPPEGLRVGREPSNGLVIQDPSVSRQHVVFWCTGPGVYVRDLGSQNGTFVNGQRLGQQPVLVQQGDRVQVGPVELLIESGAGAIRPTAPAASSSALPIVLTLVVLLAGGGLVYAITSGKIGGGSDKATPTPIAGPTATVDASAAKAPVGPLTGLLPGILPSPSPTPLPVAPTVPPTPPAAAKPAPAGGRNPGVDRALAGAVVQVIVPIGAGKASAGSGSLLTRSGYILTNAHVVLDEQKSTLANGGEAIIAIPPNEGSAAKPTFRSKVVDLDKENDLALLKIVANLDRSPLKGPLPIEPLSVGNPETVRIDDPLIIVGYPGVGGDSITVTRGIVSGIDREKGFWKTDSEVNPGNSGGAALNQAGELIGVPTAGIVSAATVSKISLVRPISFAKSLVDKAMADK